MTRVSNDASTAADQAFAAKNSLNDLDLDTFLQLMLAELQNQDPLDPLKNDQLLAQISQIREVGATDRLTDTLDSVLLGQSIASATNLIGADVVGLSDDAQRVAGSVDRVSIDAGQPKLHLRLDTQATPSSAEGNVEEGEYSYRVVWEDEDGNLMGVELSGEHAVTITEDGVEHSIELTNLPPSSTRKEIYRTDKSGEGNYQLVGILTDENQATFVDRLSDAERSLTTLSRPFEPVAAQRDFEVSLSNVSEIRPPAAAE